MSQMEVKFQQCKLKLTLSMAIEIIVQTLKLRQLIKRFIIGIIMKNDKHTSVEDRHLNRI